MSTSTEIATTQVYRVWIKATPERIWEAITSPEWVGRYGYGGNVSYELRAGRQVRRRRQPRVPRRRRAGRRSSTAR